MRAFAFVGLLSVLPLGLGGCASSGVKEIAAATPSTAQAVTLELIRAEVDAARSRVRSLESSSVSEIVDGPVQGGPIASMVRRIVLTDHHVLIDGANTSKARGAEREMPFTSVRGPSAVLEYNGVTSIGTIHDVPEAAHLLRSHGIVPPELMWSDPAARLDRAAESDHTIGSDLQSLLASDRTRLFSGAEMIDGHLCHRIEWSPTDDAAVTRL